MSVRTCPSARPRVNSSVTFGNEHPPALRADIAGCSIGHAPWGIRVATKVLWGHILQPSRTEACRYDTFTRTSPGSSSLRHCIR